MVEHFRVFHHVGFFHALDAIRRGPQPKGGGGAGSIGNSHLEAGNATPSALTGETMGVLSWILSGLVLGSIAPLVLPGRAPGGLAGTVGIGVAGAVVGGLIGTIAGFSPITDFEFRSFLLGITGAIGLLFVFRLYVDRAEA